MLWKEIWRRKTRRKSLWIIWLKLFIYFLSVLDNFKQIILSPLGEGGGPNLSGPLKENICVCNPLQAPLKDKKEIAIVRRNNGLNFFW